MNKKTLMYLLLCLFTVNSVSYGRSLRRIRSRTTRHTGELKMLEANIEFLNPLGQTVTNSDGITYYFQGLEFHEDIVYIPEYWGTYPLYMPGYQVPIKVTVTNKGPRAKAKLSIKMECYTIDTNGSNGTSLMQPQIIEVTVNRGETKVIDASFLLPQIAKELNRFTIKLYHHQNANNEASLITTKEGVFCPPEILK